MYTDWQEHLQWTWQLASMSMLVLLVAVMLPGRVKTPRDTWKALCFGTHLIHVGISDIADSTDRGFHFLTRADKGLALVYALEGFGTYCHNLVSCYNSALRILVVDASSPAGNLLGLRFCKRRSSPQIFHLASDLSLVTSASVHTKDATFRFVSVIHMMGNMVFSNRNKMCPWNGKNYSCVNLIWKFFVAGMQLRLVIFGQLARPLSVSILEEGSNKQQI